MNKFTSLKKYRLIDKETGEELETDIILIGKQLGTKIDKDFIKVTIAFLSDAIQDTELMSGPIRLLFYFLKYLDYNTGRGYLFPSKVVSELNISERTYYYHLRILLRKKYLVKLSKNEYQLLPYIAVKGSFDKQMEDIRTR